MLKTLFGIATLLAATPVVSPRILASTNLVLSVPTASDYVDVPDDYSLDLSNQFTLEAWVRLAVETGGDQTIVAKRRSPGGTGYALTVTSGRVALEMNNDTGNGMGINTGVSSTRQIAPATWYHVAGTYDGTEAVVYVNGVRKAGTSIQMTLLNSALPLTIGEQALESESRPLNGEVDEVRVWNRALSQEEIRDGMYSALTGKESGLVGYWNFNDGTARDLSIYKNHGSFVGNATLLPAQLPLLQIFTAVELVIPSGVPGGTYQLQYTTNVDSQTWFDLGAPFTAAGTEESLFDSSRARERRFYRLVPR